MAFGYQDDGGVGVGGGDLTYRKVFVGGLAWETQSHTLRRYFEQFGDILEAVVITDKNTRRSKGYGFVTFRDPFSAERACVNPAPIIDGRRANCNLAYFGQTRSPLSSSGRPRPAIPVTERVQSTRGNYGGSLGHHQPLSYIYQPGFVYPPYGYMTYGSGIVYPQGVYNPYLGQQYLQVYGAPTGTVNSGSYSHGQSNLPLPGGHNHQMIHSYGMPGHNIMQFGGSNVNGVTAAAIPTIQSPYRTGTIPGIQSPYPTGIPASAPGQTQIAVPDHSPPMPSSSDHTES